MELNIDWLRSNHTLIHYFGLGFIQLKIDRHQRLHFYTTSLPSIVHEEDIHNHRYNFTSKILSGTLLQKVYEVDPTGTDYVMLDESCNADRKVERKPVTCGVKLTGYQSFAAGSHYWTGYKTFHKVSSRDCITHVLRSGYMQDYAQVIHAKDAKPVCPFSKKVEESKLWEIVEGMINANSTVLS